VNTDCSLETECGARSAKDRSHSSWVPRWIPWRLAGPLFLVIIVMGAICTWRFARIADRDMRALLLTESSMIGKAVNVRQVLSLTKPDASMAGTDYQLIKEQLMRVRSANPACRFIYLMARRPDGTVFFLADSEPAESKDCSPLGQTYEEISAEYVRVFTTGQSAVEGPVSDRWGKWVSGLVPVVDPQTKTLVAVLGMDVDARNWNRAIVAHGVAPATVTALILLLLVVFFLVQNRTVLENRRRATTEAMSASLAAACHHISQPATVLSGYISLMTLEQTTPSMHDMIHECETATDRITYLLRALNRMTYFKAEPYFSTLLPHEDGSVRLNARILAIDGM
jgi:hypothetical protein